MPAFLATLFDLCRFRRGPEDMPCSPPLLVALLVGCALLQTWFGFEAGAHLPQIIATWIGGLGVVAAVLLLLRGQGRSERFLQTATALAAVYLVFGIVINVLIMTLPREILREALAHPTHAPTLTGGQTLALLAITVLSIWQLCVWIRILRRALDARLAGAILIFILLSLVNIGVAGLVAIAAGAA